MNSDVGGWGSGSGASCNNVTIFLQPTELADPMVFALVSSESLHIYHIL